MAIQISLPQLSKHAVALAGKLPAEELGLDEFDELMHFRHPLEYDLRAEMLGGGVLVQGSLELPLDLECARCLRPFRDTLRLPDYALHLDVEGEEKPAVVDDSIDLTPYFREDILLSLPQHPLCGSDCPGVPRKVTNGDQLSAPDPKVWGALDRLKFEND